MYLLFTSDLPTHRCHTRHGRNPRCPSGTLCQCQFARCKRLRERCVSVLLFDCVSVCMFVFPLFFLLVHLSAVFLFKVSLFSAASFDLLLSLLPTDRRKSVTPFHPSTFINCISGQFSKSGQGNLANHYISFIRRTYLSSDSIGRRERSWKRESRRFTAGAHQRMRCDALFLPVCNALSLSLSLSHHTHTSHTHITHTRICISILQFVDVHRRSLWRYSLSPSPSILLSSFFFLSHLFLHPYI